MAILFWSNQYSKIIMKVFFLKLIRFYQRYLSFDTGLFKRLFTIDKACRFYPTCSEYSYLAIKKYGIIVGGWKAFKRVLKCNPWSSGGIDNLK